MLSKTGAKWGRESQRKRCNRRFQFTCTVPVLGFGEMLAQVVSRRSLLTGAGAVLSVPVPAASRRVSAMAASQKHVLVPIGNGSEEMEAVICECRKSHAASPPPPHVHVDAIPQQQHPNPAAHCLPLHLLLSQA